MCTSTNHPPSKHFRWKGLNMTQYVIGLLRTWWPWKFSKDTRLATGRDNDADYRPWRVVDRWSFWCIQSSVIDTCMDASGDRDQIIFMGCRHYLKGVTRVTTYSTLHQPHAMQPSKSSPKSTQTSRGDIGFPHDHRNQYIWGDHHLSVASDWKSCFVSAGSDHQQHLTHP